MSTASEDNPINAYQSLRNIKSKLLSISKSMGSLIPVILHLSYQ